MPYIGKSPSSGVRQRYQYTATAGQTTFSGTDLGNLTLTYTDNNFLDCFQNGVLLKGGGNDYTATSGTSVVLATGASVNDVIEIIVYDVFSVGNFYNRTDSDSRYALTTGATMSGSLDLNGTELILDADGDTSIEASTDDTIVVDTAGLERMRVDASGNVLVGKTVQGIATAGFEILSTGQASATQSAGAPLRLNRLTDDGAIVQFRQGGTLRASIGSISGGIHFVNNTTGGIRYATSGGNTRINPCDELGAFEDNIHDIGQSAIRWDDIYATSGTVNTSDKNEKQDIANLTDKELKVANKLSTLFKTYRWIDRVAEKGDKARTHSGIIAQDIQSAFSAEGLDASNYGLFTSDTWWEKDKEIYETEEEAPKDATKKTRLGVRYTELFSFIFSSIEARLTALESKQ